MSPMAQKQEIENDVIGKHDKDEPRGPRASRGSEVHVLHIGPILEHRIEAIPKAPDEQRSNKAPDPNIRTIIQPRFTLLE